MFPGSTGTWSLRKRCWSLSSASIRQRESWSS